MLAERNIQLDLDQKAKQYLADAGYDPAYGARPLKRVIQKDLQNPLANQIIDGKIPDDSVVHITAGKAGISMTAEAGKARKKPSKDEAA